VIALNENKIIVKEKLEIKTKENNNNILKIADFPKMLLRVYEENRISIIRHLRSLPSVIDSLEQIKAGEMYRAVVPPEIIPKLKNQTVKLHKMKNGLFCPTIVDSKTKKFICHVKLEEVNPQIFDFASQMAMQNAMAEIASQLEEINEKLDNILIGQQNDRLALADSCEQQLMEALNVDDPELKKYMLANVIKTGNDARFQLLRTFEYDVKYFEDLPDCQSSIQIILKNSKNRNLNEEIKAKMNSLYNTYKAINRISLVLSFTYQELHQYQNIELSLKPLQALLQKISKNELLRKKLYDYDDWTKHKELDNIWYNEPVRAMENVQSMVNSIKYISDSTIEIEIKGEELLEANSDESM
jgi:hypothetical protein